MPSSQYGYFRTERNASLNRSLPSASISYIMQRRIFPLNLVFYIFRTGRKRRNLKGNSSRGTPLTIQNPDSSRRHALTKPTTIAFSLFHSSTSCTWFIDGLSLFSIPTFCVYLRRGYILPGGKKQATT